jgi:hypothetical protein
METIKGPALRSSEVIPFCPTDEATPAAKASHYEGVRFNAMKHGILSKLAVLAHEDHSEFDDLLAALIDEHQPAGITERHLIEELAAIIWRKRRVLLAEGAKINEGIKNVVNSPRSVMPSAAPFEHGPSGEHTDLPYLLNASPEETTERQRNAEIDLAATCRAVAILDKGGANAYEKARRILTRDSREWWDVQVQEEEYSATADDLHEYIRESLEPMHARLAQEARLVPAIKAQTLGEALPIFRLEKLSRYETHLDRKFERTLAMLLKLKELRSS